MSRRGTLDDLTKQAGAAGLVETRSAYAVAHLAARVGEDDEWVRLAAALATDATTRGDICLELDRFDPAEAAAVRAEWAAEHSATARARRRAPLVELSEAPSDADSPAALEETLPAADDADWETPPADPAAVALLPPKPADWTERVRRSPLVDAARDATPPDGPVDDLAPVARRPFVLDGGRLYTDRLYTDEVRLAARLTDLATRVCTPPAEAAPHLAATLGALCPPEAPPEGIEPGSHAARWGALSHRLAVATPTLRGLTIITGGPGTGKTFAVRKVLLLEYLVAAWQHHAISGDAPFAGPTVALAAPTGKAAARIRESLLDGLEKQLDSLSSGLAKQEIALPASMETLRTFIHRQEPLTLHRLIGTTPEATRPPRHREGNPLPYRLVVVDEASMIDLTMMRRLFEAIDPEQTRLILLGDRNQLASVDAGAVLGDLCRPIRTPSATQPALRSGAFSAAVTETFGLELPGDLVERRATPSMDDAVITLTLSHRFNDSKAAGRFAQACARLSEQPPGEEADESEVAAAVAIVADSEGDHLTRLRPPEQLRRLPAAGVSDPARLARMLPTQRAAVEALSEFTSALDALLIEGYRPYLERLYAPKPTGLSEREHHRAVLDTFDEFRVLCGHRRGPLGVEGINRRIQEILAGWADERDTTDPGRAALRLKIGKAAREGLKPGKYFIGQPLMVTRNDYTLGRRNGDIGLVVGELEGKKQVVFPGVDTPTSDGQNSELRLVEYVALSDLPEHEPCFAMTIHKSQGSQYAHVAVLLPERKSPIVTRELIYTAVTRLKQRVTLVAAEARLTDAVRQRIHRASGLAERLGV